MHRRCSSSSQRHSLRYAHERLKRARNDVRNDAKSRRLSRYRSKRTQLHRSLCLRVRQLHSNKHNRHKHNRNKSLRCSKHTTSVWPAASRKGYSSALRLLLARTRSTAERRGHSPVPHNSRLLTVLVLFLPSHRNRKSKRNAEHQRIHDDSTTTLWTRTTRSIPSLRRASASRWTTIYKGRPSESAGSPISAGAASRRVRPCRRACTTTGSGPSHARAANSRSPP
jgi:hypothetical protein